MFNITTTHTHTTETKVLQDNIYPDVNYTLYFSIFFFFMPNYNLLNAMTY